MHKPYRDWETTAQKVENMVGIGIELTKKVAEIRKNKKDTEEVEQKIENLKKTAEATEESIKLIKANIDNNYRDWETDRKSVV